MHHQLKYISWILEHEKEGENRKYKCTEIYDHQVTLVHLLQKLQGNVVSKTPEQNMTFGTLKEVGDVVPLSHCWFP